MDFSDQYLFKSLFNMTFTPESVAELLQSADYGDRMRGINQLRELPPETAYSLIKPLVTDEHPRVRYAAVSQLAVLGQVNVAEVESILRERLLTDRELDVQAAAADGMGALKLTGAYQDLEERYFQTNDWVLRLSIVATLGELGDQRALNLLKDALNTPEPLIQSAAISALGELKHPEAIPLIQPFLNDADWQTRYRVAQALTNLGGVETEPLLQILSQDEMAPVAEMAKIGLGASS
jgi:HEAT repeat protein